MKGGCAAPPYKHSMNGHVTILNYNQNASAIVASAGRISTMSGSADEIYRDSCSFEEEKNVRLIGKVISSGHTSVLEHIHLNLSFEDVSVFVEQFMIEFRLASFTVKSRRYVDFSNVGFYVPEFGGNDQMKQIYSEQVRELFGIYDQLIEVGVPKEDARFVLPYGFYSNFYCSMNARELIHVMNEMVYGRGARYPEIAALGESLFAQCEKVLPYLVQRKPEQYRVIPMPMPENLQKLSAEEAAAVLSGPEKPEELICNAAMISQGYAPQHLSEDEQKQMLRYLMQKNRKRELEQANFTILFGGLSLAALTHLTRHRMHSMCAPELLDCCNYENYVMPQSVLDANMKECYTSAYEKAAVTAKKLQELGAKPEELTYLLLSGQCVPVLTTMNAGELFVFLRLRCCTRAQWEIRDCAIALLKQLRSKYPTLFGLYGPTCFVTGRCPEGKMSCGRKTEMMEAFSGEL